jgi:para-nitrobenzyl esterase
VGVYDGRALAKRGIVVVDINYRLGVFGFLAHPELTAEAGGAPPANWALQDQVAALKWVRANIAAFGGDPEAVTIDGQSAGSMAVHDLIASPLAKGLFRAAIAESGLPSLVPMPSLAGAEQAGVAFQKQRGAASLAELRAMSAGQLANGPAPPLRFSPIVDGVLVPDDPMKLMTEGRFSNVPMIVGQTADEASALNPAWGKGDEASWRALLAKAYGPMADRFAALYPASTDAERAAASKALLEDRGLAAIYLWSRVRLAAGRAPVFAYVWDHPEPGPEMARWGAFHSSEIPYVFHSFDASPERGFTAKDEAMSEQISTYWLDFIRTGDPNAAGRPAWPKLTLERPEIMQLGDHVGVEPILPDAKLDAVKAWLAQGGQASMF